MAKTKWEIVRPHIKVRNPSVGIINHRTGSGDTLDLKGVEMLLHFDASTIRIEKSVRYNWPYQIAQCGTDWFTTEWEWHE